MKPKTLKKILKNLDMSQKFYLGMEKNQNKYSINSEKKRYELLKIFAKNKINNLLLGHHQMIYMKIFL